MRLVLGLAAASAALFAATSASAQDPGRYPPSTYDRGYGQPSSQPAYPPSGPASGYDRRDAGGYPPSTYDRSGSQGGYDRAGAGRADDRGGSEPDLARELNLSSTQRAAYRDYQAAFAPNEARERQEEDEQRRLATMTTPQRLDSARAAMERDRADFERTAAATRRFYAQLSPTQQRSFDRLTAPPPEDQGDEDDDRSAGNPAARPPR